MNRFKVVYDAIISSGAVHTQQEFAAATDISRTVISQLLNEKRELNDKQIKRICSAFPFVRAEWLKDGKGDLFTYDLPIEPSDSELEATMAILEASAREHAMEQEQLEDVYRRAELYDSKVKEVQDLYSKLQDLLTKLQQKDKEIQALNEIILGQTKTIRQLRMQIAGLKNGVNEDNQAGDPSSSPIDNT